MENLDEAIAINEDTDEEIEDGDVKIIEQKQTKRIMSEKQLEN
jgi:hypothetical protein